MKVYVVYFHGTYATGIGEFEEYDVVKVFEDPIKAKLYAEEQDKLQNIGSNHVSHRVREMEVQ